MTNYRQLTLCPVTSQIFQDWGLKKGFTDPLVALNEISNGETVDILFLDIQMPKISGLGPARFGQQIQSGYAGQMSKIFPAL